MDLRSYSESIDDLAKNKKSLIFQNSSPDHAAIVMATILKYSNDTIKIFAGGFNGKVSSDENYQIQLSSFLRRGGKIEAILDQYNGSINSTILEIFNYAYLLDPSQITLKTTNPLPNNIHFAIGDDRMFRYETNFDEYIAQVSFNRTEVVDKLSKTFLELFNDATALPLSSIPSPAIVASQD